MSDLIDRNEVIEIIESVCSADDTYWEPGTLEKIRNLPTRPTPSNTLGALDCVSREDLTKGIETYFGDLPIAVHYDMLALAQRLPSVQPEPLSDAYMKAVWTWLLNYQIKAAELKGRYTPYEVLSWVANDWRKEHEGFD